MARAELTIDTSALLKLSKRFEDPVLIKAFEQLPGDKAIAALVAQAIADNFDKEGPGWAPLKGATVRMSVSKGVQKQLLRSAGLLAARKMSATKKNKNGEERIDYQKLKNRKRWFYHYMDKEIENLERRTRQGGEIPHRQILRRTSLLFQTVTTPGSGSFSATDPDTKKSHTGQNITRVEGSNLIYGTNLIYAATHQYGDEKRGIPARPFLVIRDEWMQRLSQYAERRLGQLAKQILAGG